MSQQSFSEFEYAAKKHKTRREQFLERMERLIPWKQLTRQIQKHYLKACNGRKPYPLEVMLRVHCMQLFYNLSDPMMEDTLYEVDSVRRFCGLSLSGAIPDESIILKFRHLLEDHDLGTKLFKTINKVLDREGLMLREGTIVDASLVAAPTSTKNKDGKRDPEMHQTKKGNEWHFGILFPCLFSEKHEDSHAVKLTVEYPYLIVLLDDTSYIRPCSPSMRIIPGYSDNMVSLITSAAAQQAIAAEARL